MKKLIFIFLLSNTAFGQVPSVYNGYKHAAPTDCPTDNTYRWKFNDGSGSTITAQCGGINATTTNSPTWGTNQLTFVAASSQYASTGNSSAFDFGTSSVSVSFWIKTSTVSHGVLGNYNDEGGAVYRGWSIYIYPNSGGLYNGISVTTAGDGANDDVIFGSNSAIADNIEHNVIIVSTRAGSGSSSTRALTLYIDGSAVSQGGTGTFGTPGATTVGDISSSGNLMFGTNPLYQSLSIYFNGDLGDIRIYSTAISSGTAASIYTAGKGGNY